MYLGTEGVNTYLVQCMLSFSIKLVESKILKVLGLILIYFNRTTCSELLILKLMVEICFDSQPIKRGTQDPGSVRATLYDFIFLDLMSVHCNIAR